MDTIRWKTRRKDHYVREERLIIRALVEFLNRVDTLHRLQIAERNFVWANSDNRTVRVKKILNCLALFQAHNVRREPEVADGGIPWARNHTQRREKKEVDSAESKVEEQCKEGKGEEAVREPERREMDRRANHRVCLVVVWGSKEKFQENKTRVAEGSKR